MHALRALPNLVPVWTAALIGAVGCTVESQPAAEWDGTIRDSAGVTIVENRDRPLWKAGDEWTFTRLVRIGVVDGDSNYVFGDVGGVTVDSHGRIFVLDVQAQHVKVFSPEGEFEQVIGGPGEGPGELAGAYFAPVMGLGDTLLVADLRENRRVNRYAPDGSSVGSYPVQFGSVWPILSRATPSGEIAVSVRPADWYAESEKNDRIVVLSPEGTDTLLTFPSAQTLRLSPRFAVVLYSPEPMWAITEDSKVLFGMNDQYRIGLYASGTLERIIQKPVERMPITERDKEYHLGRFAARGRENTRFAEYYPAFNDIIAGPNGTIWVQHVRPVSELSDAERESRPSLSSVSKIPTILRDFHSAPEWDVFDAEGRFLGEVAMPPRFMPQLFRGDKIYGRWTDHLGVHYVMVLKIEGLPPFEEG
ncbi:6-bladed beta-propeller [Gemmatimonadota bacterium]